MDYKAIEDKWNRIWEESGLHSFDKKNIDRKYYVLEMFSYPSGANLHLGHWYNYGPSDSFARFKRMQGYEVLQPMGFDAFGINRVHYADKAERTKNQKLEFVWRGSASQGAKSDMFIHMMDNHYCSPSECDFFSNSSGDCMYWKEDSNWFQDNAELPTFKVNAEAKAQAFVDMAKKRATFYDNATTC